MCGGTTVNSPAPDPAQIDLERMQLQDLKESHNDIENFKPFVLQQYGLQETRGQDPAKTKLIGQIQALQANGSAPDSPEVMALRRQVTAAGFDGEGGDNAVTGYEKTAEQKAKDVQLAALQDQTLKIQQAQQQRIQDALAGKIGPSAALLDRQQNDFNVLKQDQGNNGNEIIGDNLDNATAKTTSGIQALEALRKTYGVLKDSENNAIIQGEASLPGVYQSQYAGSNVLRNPGAPGIGQGVAGLSPLYASAYQPYQNQQNFQYNADAANSKNTTNMLTGLINSGLSVAATAAPALLSSRTFKKDISAMTEQDEEALVNDLMNSASYRWRYKTEDASSPRHVGFLTEEAPPQIVTEDGKHLSVVDYFGLLTVALKVINRKLDRLEDQKAGN